MSTSARAEALRELIRISEHGAFAGFSRREDDLDERDERLATELVHGVTRMRRRLQHAVTRYYKGNFEEAEPALREGLLLGAYELCLLHRPPHAVVSEVVEAVKQVGAPHLARIANGTLRTLAREGEPEIDAKNRVKALAIRYSYPTWLIRRWVQHFGADAAEALAQKFNERPVFGVRVPPQAGQVEEVMDLLRAHHVKDVSPSPVVDGMLRTSGVQPLVRERWLQEGRCVVQDEAAALVVHVVDPKPGETIFDVCAAPGGKAFYLAEKVGVTGKIVASDQNPSRIALMERQRSAMGYAQMEVQVGAVEDRADLAERADAVLLDAPCSGTGVLAKRADLRWQRTEEEVHDLIHLQARLLDAAARLVKPGGRLVYSTCSLEPEENLQQAEAFLARNPGFVRESVQGLVPDTCVTAVGDYFAFPPSTGTDGAYAVRFRNVGRS